MTTACGAFDADAVTASPAHPSVNAVVSVLYPWSPVNTAYAGLGTLPDGSPVELSERSSVQLHGRPGGNAEGPTEDLFEDHPGGPRASWRTTGLWPTTMELGVASDLHRDGLGPPCMVLDREGCCQRIGGQPDPTRMIAASVTVTVTSVSA